MGPKTAATDPMEDEIRLRAYELYLQRGESDGSDLDDWLQAERDLSEERLESAE